MAGFTPNYQLHQWEPSDSFLRTDFNTDFSKIDTALGRADENAARAVTELERQGYDLYNLLLQASYEGKHTGWKRALWTEGFQDSKGITAKDDVLLLGRNCLSLHRTGQSDLDLGYGSNGTYRMSTRSTTCPSGGRLTGFRLRLCNTGTVIDYTRVTCSLTQNGVARFSGHETRGSYLPVNSSEEVEITFPSSYEVKQGDVLVLTAEIVSQNWSLTQRAGDGGTLGGIFRFTPIAAEQAEMTSVPLPMPEAQGARAWVRHKGGSVAITLSYGEKSWPLEADGQCETVEPEKGLSCTESSFRLPNALAEGEGTVRLNLSCGEDEYVHVYDYGVMWLG